MRADQSVQTQVYSSAMIENLINDLLDLAKLENCKFELHNEPFNLVQAIKGSFHILHGMAKHRGITLRAVIDKQDNLGLIQSIYGDERRYLQILLNFLSNSLKFTNKGGSVTVMINIVSTQIQKDDREKLSRYVKNNLSPKNLAQDVNRLFRCKQLVIVDKGENGKSENIGKEKFIHLQITVRDTGIGIKKEDLKHLFMDFGKLNDDEGRNKGGTGLGLSICKQIIEQMGGSVEVKSMVGRGTDFVIKLKLKTRVAKVELESEQKVVWRPYLLDISSDDPIPKTK